MKLLLLFLIPLCSYGQDYVFIDTNGKTFEHIKNTTQRMVEMEVDTPQTDRNPNDFYDDSLFYMTGNRFIGELEASTFKETSFEEKLLQYAQECWNDSTLENIHVGDKSAIYGYADLEPCLTKSHWELKYTHREPAFVGFMIWDLLRDGYPETHPIIQWLKKK